MKETTSEKRIEKLSEFITDFNEYLKNKKRIFTEKFYEGKDRSTMTFDERRKLTDEYREQWKIEEDKIYASLKNKQ